MKRSEAAKYARWSATAALLLAVVTSGVYLERKWTAHREEQKAPPPAPKEVSQLMNGITFSKVEGNQKIFTVEAKKATDFKDQTSSLMEDVRVTIFGRTGGRHDTIHTQTCQYEKDGESIVCSGNVQIEIESASDALRAAKNPQQTAAQMVHVETHGVTFHRSTGLAQSDQPVSFVFPNGRGEAIGLEYQSDEGAIRLIKNVSFFLTPPAHSGNRQANLSQPVHVTGKSASFSRDSRVLHLYGPVDAQSERAHLSAGELILTLDRAFRAEKLIATRASGEQNPVLELHGMAGQTRVSGETLTAYFAQEGWISKIEGAGTMLGSRSSEKETDEFSAESAVLELLPRVHQPRDVSLKGNVVLKARAEKSGESRTLETEALLVEFTQGKGGGSQPKRAQTMTRGSLEWVDAILASSASVSPGEVSAGHTKLAGDKLELEFGEEGKARRLTAIGNVATERTVPGKPAQIATAQSGVAQLLEGGGWSQVDLQGNVNLKEAERSGQADHAVFVRSAGTATLIGKAVVRDVATETRAPRITLVQNSGDIHAEGGVRSTDFSAPGTSVQLAPVTVNISANTVQANSKTGRALYNGNARLWQGEAVLEADAIELLRAPRILNAIGNIHAVFPEATGQSPARALPAQAPAQKKTHLWHVTAGTLSYLESENRAHLEKNVVAKSAEQTMRAPVVELYFSRSGKLNSSSAAERPANATTGSQQISRAVGTGGVTVEQGTRIASAERGEYTATDGKFVMSGGNPTIVDGSEGTTTGRQLTFFLAGDTIIVDSENGSRTLTKHRVEK